VAWRGAMRDNTSMETSTHSTPRIAWVVMGVSGCGKSTVGMALAQALGARFIEGDRFHPPANVAKMAAGAALGDADRAGWLQALRAEIVRTWEAGEVVVLACSALKRAYRDVLRGEGGEGGEACFVHLHGERDLLAQRMAARPGHFMPVSLLDSQLRDLEPLQPDECGITLDLQDTPSAMLARVLGSATGP
jgi:gluconokinase